MAADFHLSTFGALALTRATNADQAAGAARVPVRQTRLLALMAALAAARRGVTRDALAALLWGDQDEERARHSLDNALYEIRRGTARHAVVASGPMLLLDSGVVSSDIAAFDAAVADARWEEAASLHVAPFLDGVLLRDAPAFERWVEEERRRRLEQCLHALDLCARRSEAKGDWLAAVSFWRRLVAFDPLSGRGVAALISALARAGDRATALRAGDDYLARVREMPGAKPDSQAADVLARLRTDGATHTAEMSGVTGDDAFTTRVAEAVRPRYRVEGGGPGATYYRALRGRDLEDGAAVEIKVLKPEIVLTIDARHFLARCAALLELDHPRLLRTFDAAARRGLVFVVGEPANGPPLRERVAADGALSLAAVERLARDVGQGLAAAHEAGVLHLDLTPRRVVSARDGFRVIDTGLVAALRHSLQPERDGLRETGLLLGNRSYMSPEVADGVTPLDRRADVFSLGCVLLFALTGTPAATPGYSGYLAPPDVRSLRPGVSAALAGAVQAAVAPVRADRPETIDAFLAAAGLR